MKNPVLTYSLFLFISVFLSSCSTDEGSLNQNSVTHNGTAYNVSNPTILGVSLNGEGHIGISLINADGQDTTNVLTIDIEYFTDQTMDGNYAFPLTTGMREINGFLTNYAESSSTSIISNSLIEGTLSLTHNGEKNYTLVMDLIMENNITFAGTYTGDFIVYFNNG